MKSYIADLHNHSCLSPCGDLEMSPRNLVRTARERGIEILALTDHNSALNCPAFEAACKEADILGIFGLEITTVEEIHVLALFEKVSQALDMGECISRHFNSFPNQPDKMGDQVYVDAEENIAGEVEQNLAQGASDFSLEDLGKEIHAREGLFIPAHIDRPSFSLISQLGFVPSGPYDALEALDRNTFSLQPYPVISGSDAHYLQDIGKRSFTINCRERNFFSIKKSLKSS